MLQLLPEKSGFEGGRQAVKETDMDIKAESKFKGHS